MVVVGGGIAGISAACRLKEAGYTTVLIEQDEVGNGATGASSGMLYYGSGPNLAPAMEIFGKEKAIALWKETAGVIREIEEAIEKNKIECGISRFGGILAAKTDEELKELEAEQAALKECGISSKILNSKEVMNYFAPREFLAGLTFFDICSQIRPAKFAAGLAKEVGLEIYENTELKSWKEEKKGITVETPKARISASKMVFATNLQPYFRLDEHFMVEESTIIVSQKVKDMKKIWPEEKIIMTMEEQYDIIYPTYDSSRVVLEVYSADNQEAKLKDYYRGFDFRCDKEWGGVWAKTKDWLPIMGKVSENVLVDIAMGDQGIIMGWTCGNHIVNALEGKSDWFLEMVTPKRFKKEKKA